jgi:hypothetical protein
MPHVLRVPLWLEQIPEQIGSVSDTRACLAEIYEALHPDDHLVGIVEERWRKVLVRAFHLARAAALIYASLEQCVDPEEIRKSERRANLLEVEANTLKENFYCWLLLQFPELLEKPSFNLRNEWEIVWSDQLPKGTVLALDLSDDCLVSPEKPPSKALMH